MVSVAAYGLGDRGLRLAARCGVTRLADITHLDCLGAPVFQAIRPWSRGLSVHQGKGLTREAAALGALMEAVEHHFAETFQGPVTHCAFADLPAEERAARVCDFTFDQAGELGAEEPIGWVRASRIGGDEAPFWLPFDLVSLDFSRLGDPRLDRSSDGLACRFDMGDASRIALMEVVERDAVARFLASSTCERTLRKVDLASVTSPWLDALRKRMEAAGILLTLYHAQAVIALPVLVCELLEPDALGLDRSQVFGSACHFDAETTLVKAVLEAVQSRLTAIVGARDDILPERSLSLPPAAGFSLPQPPGTQPAPWLELTTRWTTQAGSADAVADLLRVAGYPVAAAIELTQGDEDVTVVKVFVPGLASSRRMRRPPHLSH